MIPLPPHPAVVPIQETTMLKTFSRLICFGSARASTNAELDDDPAEDNVILGYPE